MNGKVLIMVVMGILALFMLNGCRRENDRHGYCGKSSCHKEKESCKMDISALVEELNLTEGQQKEFKKIKRTVRKEIRKEFMFNFSGKVDHEKMIAKMIGHLEEFENILDPAQKEKFRKIVLEKYLEKHIQHGEKMEEMISKAVPKLNLTAEQKTGFDLAVSELKSAKMPSQQLAAVNKINTMLTPEQQKNAFNVFKESCPKGKNIEKLNLTDNQLDQFILFNGRFIPKMADSFARYEKGEQQLSATLKELMAEKEKVKAVFTPEQLKSMETLKKDRHQCCHK